jgi:glycoside/pentoside/hexuronide:cation symporter, GPH family
VTDTVDSRSAAEENVPKWAYAAPAFALAFVGIPVYVYLPQFYTDVIGVDIALVGFILLGARAFDAITDPAIGVMSDRTKSRWGRRRPYILGASIPLAISIALLLRPPAGLSPSGAAWWFGVTLFAMFLSWTVMVVPYEALGPELTFDFHRRTAVLGARDALLILGTVIAAASPGLVGALMDLPPGAEGERIKFALIGAVYAPLIVITAAYCASVVRERAVPPAQEYSLAEGWAALRDNRAFWILLSAYTFGTLAFNLAGAMLLYYVRYVLISDSADIYLVIYLVSGVACLPLWIRASRRIGKRASWLIGMGTYAVGGTIIFFLGEGDGSIYAVLCFVTGMTFGPTVAIPASMQADVIDYDELLTGQRREGLFMGIWSVVRKLAAALGVGVALPILAASGYQPNQPQGETTQFALRTLYVGVPVICNLIAMAIAWRYPIDAATHADIRAKIDAAQSSASSS